MTNSDFHQIAEQQFEDCKKLLGIKEGEYDTDVTDRLAFFKDAGAFTGDNPKQALIYMMLKHVKSICDMAKEDSANYPKWLEKITDNINYLTLLRALVEEERLTYAVRYADGAEVFTREVKD